MRALPCTLALAALLLLQPTPSTARAIAAGGFTRALVLSRSAHDVPPGAPNVIVHAPARFDPSRPLWLVVFLHGWRGCARVLMASGPTSCRDGSDAQPGWALGARHDEAGTNSLFIIPQLAFDRRDGSPGRLARPGFARAWLEELLDSGLASSLGHPRGLGDVERITLVAHSAGYESALSLLRVGELPALRDVVLMDALYGGARPFADWMMAAPDRTLFSAYTNRGNDVGEETLRLYRLVRRRDPELPRVSFRGPFRPDEARGKRLVVMRSHAPHREVPSRHLPEILRALADPAGAR